MALDWSNGTWQREKGREPEDRILITGDWVPAGGHPEVIAADPAAVYGDLLHVLAAADLCIVNLECPLVDEGTGVVKDGPNLRANTEAIASLAAVPFHIACLANNHTYDYGPEALNHTRELLHDHDIRTVGAGRNAEEAYTPLITSVGRTRVGLVNFCEGEDNTSAGTGPGVAGFDLCRLTETVRRLRKDVDVLIVIGHVGREYVPVPPPYVVDAFQKLADAGADAVVGHHPHVPQGIAIHNGTPLVYSLGNFVFDFACDLFYRQAGYVVELGISSKKLSGLRIVPYLIGSTGLRKLNASENEFLFDRLRAVSDCLSDSDRVRDVWEAVIDSFGKENWLKNCLSLRRLTQDLAEKPEASAARIRNRFMTMAHRELIADAMTRLMKGKMETAPRWAKELVAEWNTLTIDEWTRRETGSITGE